MRACGWQLIVVKMGVKCLKGLVFCRKAAKVERTTSPGSPIFRSQTSFFRLQTLFSARHTPLFHLISLHERRSRNMMARVVRRELAVISNLIRAVKRSPKTSFQQPFVLQTLPPGRT